MIFLDTLSDARWTVANLAVLSVLGALALAPIVVVILVLLHGIRHATLPTQDARAPLNHRLADRYYDLKMAEANAQARTVPKTFSYAPKLAYRTDAPLPLPAPAQPASLPSARELLALPGLVLGVADTGPLVEPEFVSVGIAGRPGSGKSVTLAGLAVQVAAKGGSVHLVDAHAGHSQSLVSRVEAVLGAGHVDVGANAVEAVLVAERVVDELRRRMRMARVGAAHDRTPVALLVDEWTSFMRGSGAEQLEKLLITIISEGRKYGVLVALSAQSWSARVVGGSFVRNPLPVGVVHRTRGDEARMLAGPRVELPGDVISLPTGSAYVVNGQGVSRVTVPELSGALSNPVPELVAPPTRTVNGQRPDSPVDSGQEAEILTLFRSGHSAADIVRTLWGLDPGGRAWQEARRDVEAVIRRALA